MIALTPSFFQALPARTKRFLPERRVLSCLGFGIVQQGGSQLIRFGGNLLLTRLLFPEVFGLMALANVFLVGLDMLSDVGITQAIVSRREAPSRIFLQTAWTIQIIRGFSLFLGSCLLALPLAEFYHQPELLWLLPLLGGTRLLTGFRSMSFALADRQLKVAGPTIITLLSAVVGVITSVLVALSWADAKALVVGAYVSAFFYTGASFWLPSFRAHQLRLAREAWQEIGRFGRWILFSTIVSFLALQGDRLLLGRLLSGEMLGLYTLSYFFVQAFLQFVSVLGAKSLTPIYARTDDLSKARLLRRMICLAALPVYVVFVEVGDLLIAWFYDPRYHFAGDLLEIICLGMPPIVLRLVTAPWLLARGDARGRFILSLIEAGLTLSFSLVGWSACGLFGFLAGMISAQFLLVFVTYYLVRQHAPHDYLFDFCFLTVAAVFGIREFAVLIQCL